MGTMPPNNFQMLNMQNPNMQNMQNTAMQNGTMQPPNIQNPNMQTPHQANVKTQQPTVPMMHQTQVVMPQQMMFAQIPNTQPPPRTPEDFPPELEASPVQMPEEDPEMMDYSQNESIPQNHQQTEPVLPKARMRKVSNNKREIQTQNIVQPERKHHSNKIPEEEKKLKDEKIQRQGPPGFHQPKPESKPPVERAEDNTSHSMMPPKETASPKSEMSSPNPKKPIHEKQKQWSKIVTEKTPENHQSNKQCSPQIHS